MTPTDRIGEDVTLYNADALAVLPTLPDASVHLIATDPPYFGVKDHEWDNQWATAAEYLDWVRSLCREFRRVLAPNGSLYLFASPEMAARVECVVGESFNVLNSIRWKKTEGWAGRQCKEEQRAFFPNSEAVVFAEQYGGDAVADDASGYTSACADLHRQVYAPVVGKAVREKREGAGLQRHEVDSACSPSRKPTGLCYRWEEGACLPTEEQWVGLCRLCGDRREYEALRREYEALRRPFSVSEEVPYTDVWEFRTVNTYPGKHPCEKPLRMLEHIVRASSRPGDTVLDCFLGSGVAGQACMKHGRKFIGVERDEGYYATAVKRLTHATGAGAGQLFAATGEG